MLIVFYEIICEFTSSHLKKFCEKTLEKIITLRCRNTTLSHRLTLPSSYEDDSKHWT